MKVDAEVHRERRPATRAAGAGNRTDGRARGGDDAAQRTRRTIARAQRGDPDALRDLYVIYADTVYRYVAMIVRDHHEAEDVTQQVFAKLIGCLSCYEDRGAPFLSWLLRLARNVAIDHLRARRAIPVADLPEHASNADGSDLDRLRTLRNALGLLPEDQREIIVLRHVAGLAPGEIAARLRRTEAAVHGLHHRGRRALRAELKRQGAAPVTLAG